MIVAGPSPAERINRLQESIATLDERLKHLRVDMDRLRENQETAAGRHHDLDKDVAVLREQVQRLSKETETRSSRSWQLWLALIAAFLSFIISLLNNGTVLAFVRSILNHGRNS